MTNLLLEKAEYQIIETRYGIWKRYLYPSGMTFSEFKSNITLFNLPLIHYTNGICPETGKRIIATGIIAIGRIAKGFIPFGQFAIGLLPIGQLSIGLIAFGQGSIGFIAVGQVAIGLLFGIGQLATGIVAIGQFAIGKYVLCQIGFGKYVWSMKSKDPAAIIFFKSLFKKYLT